MLAPGEGRHAGADQGVHGRAAPRPTRNHNDTVISYNKI